MLVDIDYFFLMRGQVVSCPLDGHQHHVSLVLDAHGRRTLFQGTKMSTKECSFDCFLSYRTTLLDFLVGYFYFCFLMPWNSIMHSNFQDNFARQSIIFLSENFHETLEMNEICFQGAEIEIVPKDYLFHCFHSVLHLV